MGYLLAVWLAYILSRGDHRLSHVQPWVKKRLHTLHHTLNAEITPLDLTDDRLAAVLRLLSEDRSWQAFEQALCGRLLRVYALEAETVRIDTTSASGYSNISEGGPRHTRLPRPRRRPLPLPAGQDAMRRSAAEGVPEERGCSGSGGDLGPGGMPRCRGLQGQRAAHGGAPDGEPYTWTERRLVVRSRGQAEAAEKALQGRLAKAEAQLAKLNERERGKRRYDERSAFEARVETILKGHKVEALLQVRIEEEITTRTGRAYGDQPMRIQWRRRFSGAVRRDEAALVAGLTGADSARVRRAAAVGA